LHIVEQQEWVQRLARVGPELVLLVRGLARAPHDVTVLRSPGEEKAQHVGLFLFPKSSQSWDTGRATGLTVPESGGSGDVSHADHCLGTMLAR